MAAPEYDAVERAREKQASREDDERALASGEVSRDELRAQNGRAAFPNARVLFDRARSLV